MIIHVLIDVGHNFGKKVTLKKLQHNHGNIELHEIEED